MNALLEPLLNSPRLPDFLAELQGALAREQECRERFYEEITPEHKWEFVNGEVIMHSPATAQHASIRKRLERYLSSLIDLKHLGFGGGEKVMVSFPRNDYEPDFVFFDRVKAAAIRPDQWKFPVPDFVIEILSKTTAQHDRGVKFEDYAAHGVREYWIVDPQAETIEQYLLGDAGVFTLRAKQDEGTLHSDVIAGLRFPVRAAFDDAENLKAVRGLLAES